MIESVKLGLPLLRMLIPPNFLVRETILVQENNLYTQKNKDSVEMMPIQISKPQTLQRNSKQLKPAKLFNFFWFSSQISNRSYKLIPANLYPIFFLNDCRQDRSILCEEETRKHLSPTSMKDRCNLDPHRPRKRWRREDKTKKNISLPQEEQLFSFYSFLDWFLGSPPVLVPKYESRRRESGVTLGIVLHFGQVKTAVLPIHGQNGKIGAASHVNDHHNAPFRLVAIIIADFL